MNYAVFAVFLMFFIIVFLDRFYADKIVRKEVRKFFLIKNKIRFQKDNVRCETLTIGRKNINFHYRKADLIFLEDAFCIIGYYTFFSKKIYRSLLILTKDREFYQEFVRATKIIAPKNINKNSTNGKVYIEFGEASFVDTNVQIWLKNLSEIEKGLIVF